MWTKYFLFILVAFCFLSCDGFVKNVREKAAQKTEKKDKKKKKLKNGVFKRHHADGSLKTEVNFVEGRQHGEAREYYQNGNLKLVVNYEHGVKEGVSKYYYENGKLYRETPFQKGEIHGIRKVYAYGKLAAEIPYREGFVGAGLREYSPGGKLLTEYPEIEINAVDTRKADNLYTLEIAFSTRSNKDEFYIGELADGKYLHASLDAIQVKNGVGSLVLEIPPGARVEESLNIIGVNYTRQRNPYVATRTFRLVIK